MLNKPDISVITLHHTGELIFKFLESIRKSKDVTYEIILVTSDLNIDKEKTKDCILIHSNEMPARKRNIGSYVAKGDCLAFFDDDTEIDENCLKRFKAHIDSSLYIGMVYGKLHKADEPHRFDEAGGYMTSTGFIWSRAGQNIVDNGQYDEPVKILAGKSASCMVRKDVFEEVGGFDESFGILGEETDLSWRIWLIGYQVWFTPSATGIHYFNTKFKPVKQYYNSERVQYNGSRNYLTMLIKNLGRRHLWIIPIHFMIWLSAGFAMILTGKVRQGWNVIRGLSYVLRNLKSIIGKRHRIQSNRSIDESNLWRTIHHKTPRGYYLQRFFRYTRTTMHG